MTKITNVAALDLSERLSIAVGQWLIKETTVHEKGRQLD